MKQRTSKKTRISRTNVFGLVFKVLLSLVLVLAGGISGRIGGGKDDLKVSANDNSTGKYEYVFEVTHISGGANHDLKEGEHLTINVDFSSNTATFNKTGWSFGDVPINEGEEFPELFTNAEYLRYPSPISRFIRPMKSSSATLNEWGIMFFEMGRGGMRMLGHVNGKNNMGIDTPYEAEFTLLTKTATNGNSCGYGTKKIITLKVESNTVPPSRTLGFNAGESIKLIYDEKENTLSTDRLGWGVNDHNATRTLSLFNLWFTDDANPTKVYMPWGEMENAVYYFESNTGVLSEYGKTKVKEMMGSNFYWGLGSSAYREDVNYPIKYGNIFDFSIENIEVERLDCGANPSPTNPSTPPSTTCAVGLTPKGVPGTDSFYCEKVVKQTEYRDPQFFKDVRLSDLITNMGDYGSTGDREDGQFSLDMGNHTNGWFLTGKGENYKESHIQFTNVPDDGYVNAVGNSWSPEYLISQGGNKINVKAVPDTADTILQKRQASLNNFRTTNSLSEIIIYKVTDITSLKSIQDTDEGLMNLFSKTGSNYTHGNQIVYHKIDSTGEGDYSKLKVNDSGYYILASKFVDMVGTKNESPTPTQDLIDKHTYYSFIPINIHFMTDLGFLPIHNNLLTQINDSFLTIGGKKANHQLGNLTYQSYKSMKVPSAYNHVSRKTLIGSTSGGLQLLDENLTPVTLSGYVDAMNVTNVNAIVEYGKGFYLGTDKGILFLNCDDNTLSKTIIQEPVNDLDIYYDNLYYLTNKELSMLFVDGMNIVKSTKTYDLSTMFTNPILNAGSLEVIGGLLTIASKDEGSLSEVITLSK